MATLFLILIYMSFVSLGLPDSMLGASWPVMHTTFGVATGFAGGLSMTIALGTVISSLLSGKVISRFGTGRVTFVSVMATAAALLGYSLSPSYITALLCSIPLGLGAGAVDAGLNEYVAEHYASRHMNWLHCFWGLGAMLGPLLLSFYLSAGKTWRSAYLTISVIQFVLAGVLFISLPMWSGHKKPALESTGAATESAENPSGEKSGGTSLLITVLLTFFLYCSLESTCILWGSSYFSSARGVSPAVAAGWASAFFASITIGRFVTGIFSSRLGNRRLIFIGEAAAIAGAAIMLLSPGKYSSLAGFTLIGLGCAPIYPCMLHETPVRFGAERARNFMGLQMAVAYMGTMFMPPLFGLISSSLSVAILPAAAVIYSLGLLIFSQLSDRLPAARKS